MFSAARRPSQIPLPSHQNVPVSHPLPWGHSPLLTPRHKQRPVPECSWLMMASRVISVIRRLVRCHAVCSSKGKAGTRDSSFLKPGWAVAFPPSHSLWDPGILSFSPCVLFGVPAVLGPPLTLYYFEYALGSSFSSERLLGSTFEGLERFFVCFLLFIFPFP